MNYGSLIVLLTFLVIFFIVFSKVFKKIPNAFRMLCRIFFEERERSKNIR